MAIAFAVLFDIFLLGLVFFVNRFASLQSAQTIRLISHLEGYPIAETAAWHDFNKNGGTTSWCQDTPCIIAFANRYDDGLTGAPSAYSSATYKKGEPLNVLRTLQFDSAKTLVRRYLPGNLGYHYTPIKTEVEFCGLLSLPPKIEVRTCLATICQPAVQDFSFDTDGKVDTLIGNETYRIHNLAVQPDGKILAVGDRGPAGSGPCPFVIVRYLANGTLDTTFDGDGKLITTFGSSSANRAKAVVLQTDGKIIVAGHEHVDPGNINNTMLVRLNADGSPDGTFGTNGVVIRDFNDSSGAIVGDDDQFYSVALLGNQIVAVGNIGDEDGDVTDFLVARFLTDGTLDTSFNSPNGFQRTDFGGSGQDDIRHVLIQSDGKILAVGYAKVGSQYEFALARYLPTGVLDTSFDGDGKLTTALGSNDNFAYRGALQPADGKIVVAGHVKVGGDYHIGIARYEANGALDTTFDGDGKVIVPIPHSLLPNFKHGNIGLSLDSKGNILVASGELSGSDHSFVVIRLKSNGAIDTEFDPSGKVAVPFGSKDAMAFSLLIQPDGKLVAGGTAYQNANKSHFALLRLKGCVPP